MPHASTGEPLTLDAVTAISRDIAAEYDSRLRVAGVASAERDSGRVELLVTIEGCHIEPCVVMVNVTRTRQPDFERDLREKFSRALAAHVTSD